MEEGRGRARRIASVGIPLLCGLLVGLLAGVEQAQRNAALVGSALERQAERLATRLVQRLQIYQYGLRGARGVVTTVGRDGVTRALFRRYSRTRDMAAEFPGARGMGLIWRVDPADEARFLARARAEGPADFDIHAIGAAVDERFVIQYIEPLERNRAALGLDIASEPLRRAAALQALRSGAATLTAPITLVQARGEVAQAFLLLLPIYRDALVPPTESDRLASGLGWSYAPLLISEILAGLQSEDEGLALAVLDVTEEARPVLVFRAPGETATDAPRVVMERDVYGRRWRLDIAAQPRFAAAQALLSPQSAAVAAGATTLLGTALLAALWNAARRRREQDRRVAETLRAAAQRLEGEVEARTGDLRQANSTLRTVLDSVPSMIGYWDQDLVNRVANRAYAEWFGREPASLPGTRMAALLGEDWLAAQRPLFARVLEGEPQRREMDLRRADGSLRHLLVEYLPDRVDGAVRGFYVFANDVTDITESRRALAVERQRLAQIIEGTHVGTWEWEVPSGAVIFDERWAEICGYRLADLAPLSIDTWVRLTHPDDLAESNRLLQAHFAGTLDYYDCECRMRHRDGHWVWVHDRGRLVERDVDGSPRRMSGTHSDITARKLAEAELRRVATLLGNVLDAASEVSIIATDPAGIISLFNRGAERMLGYRADELVGLATPACFHDADEVRLRGETLSAEVGEAVAGFRVFVHRAEREGAETREWTYVRKDGRRLPVQLAVTTMRSDEGAIIGYLGIAQDITERRRVERMKSEFVATVSHELRTPLTAIAGALRLLLAGMPVPLPEASRTLVDMAARNAQRLAVLINDLLDIEKLAAGQLPLSLRVQPLRPILELALDSNRTYGVERGVVIELVEADPEERAEVDADRLLQVLANLLSNAIKFSPDGGRVTLAMLVDGDSLRIRVADQGPGVPEEFRARLFERFAQHDSSDSRARGGTGLGLAISRELMRRMRGDLTLREAPAPGSVFEIRLPRIPDAPG